MEEIKLTLVAGYKPLGPKKVPKLDLEKAGTGEKRERTRAGSQGPTPRTV